MNKKIFILALTSTLLFTGCSKKNANKKGDVVNDAVLKANTKEIKKSIYSDYNLTNRSLPVENISKVIYQDGFLIITDTEGKYSFYSVIKDSLICGPVAENNFETDDSKVSGGFLRVTEAGVTNIYDALGNNLIANLEQPFTSITFNDSYELISDYDGYYCEIKIDSNSHYFTYASDGSATLVTTISSDGGSDFGPGSSVQGITYTSLKNYGHEGYKRYENSGRYIIFDKNNQEVSSFSDPAGEAEFFVGDYLYYQNSTKLADTDSNYDYINQAGEKYSLETYKINYLTAKKESVNLKYVFGTNPLDVRPFFSDKSVYSYVYANVRTISDKKVLNKAVETYIIDSNGALHDNVTGIDMGAFERFGKNYYNTGSKTIYDGNLNEISILTDITPSKNENSQLIIGQIDGNYGAVNSEGKVVIPFEYQMIYSSYLSNNSLLALYNGKLSQVSFDATNCTSRISKTYTDYSYKSLLGAGVFELDKGGKSYYASLFSDAPSDLVVNPSATLTINASYADVINKAALSVLETEAGALSSYRSGSINISR